MKLSLPAKFAAAIRYLQRKGLLPTTLKTAQLATLDAEIRRTATFSAQVTDASFLSRISEVINQIVDPPLEPGGYMSAPKARDILRAALREIGYAAEAGKEGSLEDLASERRLNVIIKTNTEMAQGYGQHVEANDPLVLDAFPCQELYRAQTVEEPRQTNGGDQFSPREGYGGLFWPRKWQEHGGKFYGGGRMIARKDDPVWTGISRFGNPYPPFDFNSGMWVMPVSRAEAVKLGVLAKTDRVQRSETAFATPRQAGIAALTPSVIAALQRAVPGAAVVDGVLTAPTQE